MTLFEFIKQYYDVPNTGDTPQNMGQCVGLVEAWIDSLSLPHVWGNAADLLANADSNSYDIIQNTPDNIPSFGDIFCFDGQFNPNPDGSDGAGHTGIVVAADTNLVSLFEQNDDLNDGTPQIKTYTYAHAKGWLHPKGVVVDEQSLISALENQRDTNWNLHLADQKTIQTLQSQIEQDKNEIESLSAQLETAKQEVTPVPETTATTASTEIPLTASTTGGSTIVNASVTTTESANTMTSDAQPVTPTQTTTLTMPKKQAMRLSNLIVWILKNIKSILFK